MLTCSLEDGPINGFNSVCDGLDGDGIVPARLKVGEGEVGLVHDGAAAVPVEGLQLVVRHLRRRNETLF